MSEARLAIPLIGRQRHAETIRDSMLKVSGLLNDKMFGRQEPIKRGPDGQWLEDNQGSGAVRRSLYLAQTRTRSVAFRACGSVKTLASRRAAPARR